ncbi:MAG: hypothetical protein AB1491_00220 [Thermodesulfobacteriota bacterium]
MAIIIQPDPPENVRGGFFCSVIDPHSNRWALLAGPFDTHQEAKDNLYKVQKITCDTWPEAHWLAFGTCRVKAPPYPPARLKTLGLWRD